MSLIEFAGQRFELCPSGAIFWPEKNILIVSDLHFEKSSYFAAKGAFLPPHDTAETLHKLDQTCSKFEPSNILFLGDVFHDVHALGRLNEADQNILKTLLQKYKIIWVEGNHDPGIAPEGITALSKFEVGNIIFNHIATRTPKFEISGHYHPSIKFTHKGQNVRRPCFFKSEKKLILPSYGVLTGGLDVSDKAYDDLMALDAEVFALGHSKVYKVKEKYFKRGKA